jgi:hypothetical protein
MNYIIDDMNCGVVAIEIGHFYDRCLARVDFQTPMVANVQWDFYEDGVAFANFHPHITLNYGLSEWSHSDMMLSLICSMFKICRREHLS